MLFDVRRPTRQRRIRETFIQMLRDRIWFPFLLPVFFVLHIARRFYGGVRTTDVLVMTVLYVGIAALLYLLPARIIRNRLVRGCAVFLFMVLCLYWVEPMNFFLRLFGLANTLVNQALIVAAYMAFTVWLCAALSQLGSHSRSRLQLYLNTLFALFIVLELGYIAVYAMQGRAPKKQFVARDGEQLIDRSAQPGGNIYLLLFDEYASSATMRDSLRFDNSAMDSFLKSRGFFLNNRSRSNYWWTQFSVASLLNMDYFRGFREPYNYCTERQQLLPFRAIDDARLAKVLQHAGYRISAFSIFDFAGHPRHDAVAHLPVRKHLIWINTLYARIAEDYLPYLRYRAELKKNPAFRYPPFYRIDDYNKQCEQFVLRAARQQGDVPRFVYAHFMMPHPPCFYDSTGRLMPMERIKAITSAEAPRYYTYNVRHANQSLLRMTDSILRHDPRAAIVILGDHGYRYNVGDGWHPSYFRNLSAVYFPDHDYRSLPDSFSNVNVFRLVLNKVCGTRYPLLPDSCCTLAHAP